RNRATHGGIFWGCDYWYWDSDALNSLTLLSTVRRELAEGLRPCLTPVRRENDTISSRFPVLPILTKAWTPQRRYSHQMEGCLFEQVENLLISFRRQQRRQAHRCSREVRTRTARAKFPEEARSD